MVSELLDAERRRTTALIAVAFAAITIVWFELNRQIEQDSTRIDTLTADQLGHAGRSQGVSSVFKAVTAVIGAVGAIAAVAVLFATHTL